VLAALTCLEDHIRATVAPREIEGVENVARALAAAVDSLGSEE
jgi:hypothetical protein